MKSLLDIQQDIKALEHSFQEISNTIKELNLDIQHLRDEPVDLDIDYDNIRRMSKHIQFQAHPIANLSDDLIVRKYIEFLLSLIQLDKDDTVQKLIFIQWINSMRQSEFTLEDLYKESLQISSDDLNILFSSLDIHYKRYLIIDMLIIANLTGSANAEILSYIADTCSIIGINKEQLSAFSILAKVILYQSNESLSSDEAYQIIPFLKSMQYYLPANIQSSIFISMRNIAVMAADTSVRAFKWKVMNMSTVQTGLEIASGHVYENNSWRNRIFKANSNGVLFRFRDKCINYGVIAHPKDNKDSIKAWAINVTQGGTRDVSKH